MKKERSIYYKPSKDVFDNLQLSVKHLCTKGVETIVYVDKMPLDEEKIPMVIYRSSKEFVAPDAEGGAQNPDSNVGYRVLGTGVFKRSDAYILSLCTESFEF